MSIDAHLTRAGYSPQRPRPSSRRGTTAGFTYTDGDEVEERLDRIVEAAADRSVDLARARPPGSPDWPSLYHLSPRRSNLLRPFVADMPGSVLEIGDSAWAAPPGSSARRARRCSRWRAASVAPGRGATLRRPAGRARRRRAVPVASAGTGSGYDAIQQCPADRRARVRSRSLREPRRRHGPRRRPARRGAADARRDDGILHLAIENQAGLQIPGRVPRGSPRRSDARHRGPLRPAIDRHVRPRGAAPAVSTPPASPPRTRWFPLPEYKLPATLISERAVGHGARSRQHRSRDRAPSMRNARPIRRSPCSRPGRPSPATICCPSSPTRSWSGRPRRSRQPAMTWRGITARHARSTSRSRCGSAGRRTARS